MKRNTLKRILAGSLALLTVAAYFPANVGKGIVDTISLVASARDEAIKADTTGINLNSIENGDYFESDTTLNKPENDSKTYTVTLLENVFTVKDADNNVITGDSESGVIKFNDVKKIEYTTMDKENNIKNFVLKITNVEKDDDNPVDVVYTVTMTYDPDTTTYANFCEKNFIRAQRAENGNVTGVDYTFDVQTVVNSVTLYYSIFDSIFNFDVDVDAEYEKLDASKYIQSITYTDIDGKEKTKTDINASTNLIVKAKKNVTIKSTAMLLSETALNDDFDGFSDYLTGYENGVFTYTFNAVDSRKFLAKPAALYFNLAKDDDTDKFIAPEDKRTATVQIAGFDDDNDKIELGNIEDIDSVNPFDYNIPVGAKITVSSPTSFEIKNGTITGYENGEFTYGDVKGVYSNGMFTKEFVFSGKLNFDAAAEVDGDDVTTVTLGAFPTTVEYIVSANKITANDTDPENPVIQNAQVAFVDATAYVPQYKDGAKTKNEDDIKVDANNEKVFTKTAIADNGSVAYDPDGNSRVDLTVVIDPALIGKSGTSAEGTGSGKRYEAVIKKDGEKVATYTYKPDEDKDEDKFEQVDAEGNDITDGDYFIDNNKNDNPYESYNEKGFTVGLKNAGKYEVELTVWSANNKAEAKIAKYTYTVTPATNISEDDIEFIAYHRLDAEALAEAEEALVKVLSSEDASPGAITAAEKAVKDAQKKALKVTKNADGVYEVATHEADLAEPKEENGKNVGGLGNVTLEAHLKIDNKVAFTFAGGQISGVMEAPNSTKLSITEANYNITPIAITWKLVEAAEEDGISFKAKSVGGYDTDSENKVNSTLESLETVVKKSLASTNDIDVSNATFKFTKGAKLDNDSYDIDALNAGLPTINDLDDNERAWYASESTTELTTDAIKFYIYATVGNLETSEPLEVTITKEDTLIGVNALLTKTQFTYGEVIKPEDIGFINAAGEVIDGITADKINKITITRIKDADGKKVDVNSVNNAITGLIPGTYTAIIDTNLDDDAPAVALSDDSKESYAYKTVNELVSDDAARADRIKGITVEFTVAKKALESYMVKEITETIKGGKATINDSTFSNKTVVGVNNDAISVSVTGGISSATEPGVYEADIKPVGDSEAFYTGTCKAKWYAVSADATTPVFELASVSDNYNIYDATDGVQLHIEAQLMKKDTNDPLTAAELKEINKEDKIVRYGMIVEKAGEFKDYKNEKDDIAKVEEKLRYGFGYTETGYNETTKKYSTINGSDGLRVGVNSRISSIDDYIWFRPYAVTESGQVVYGSAERVDFTTIANKVVQPCLDATKLKLVQKNGALRYYAYATKKDNTTEGNKRTVEPKAFGVVISRTGNYADVADVTIADVLDGTTPSKTMTDTAKKAYAEEIEKIAANLTLETCDVKSTAVANNTNYTEHECGTLVRITDSTSNVYVRTYVDFGNGMVVYSDPQVIESASAQLAEAMKLRTFENPDSNKSKYYMQARRSKDGGVLFDALASFTTGKSKIQTFEDIKINVDGTAEEDIANQVTEFGLVIDKNNTAKGDKKLLVKGNGYLEIQSKTPNENMINEFTGIGFSAVTNIKNTKASARAYVVYKDVAVYADNIVVNDSFTDANNNADIDNYADGIPLPVHP